MSIQRWQKTAETDWYKRAVEVSEGAWPPGEGFITAAKGQTQSTTQAVQAIERQNNTQLFILTTLGINIDRIYTKLEEIELRLTKLEAQAKGTAADPVLAHSIEELSKGLEKIHIGGAPAVQQEKKPKLFVYSNPYTAARKEFKKSQGITDNTPSTSQ